MSYTKFFVIEPTQRGWRTSRLWKRIFCIAIEWYPQCLTLYPRSRIKPCRYNRVRLYLDPDPLEYQAGAVSWTASFPNEDHVSTATLFPTQTHWNAPTPPRCWFGVQKPNETSVTQQQQCRHCTVRRIYSSPKQASVSHARTHARGS